MKIPDALLGRQIACPTCRNVFTASFARAPGTTDEYVVQATAEPIAYTGAGLAPAPAPAPVPASAPPPYPVEATVDRRACPFCGEVIQSIARKCKHCGETLDPLLRAQGKGSHSNSDLAGTLSLVFGSIAMVCTALMLFTRGLSAFAALPFGIVGLVVGFYSRGQLKIAALVLNLVALVTSLMAVVLVLIAVFVSYR